MLGLIRKLLDLIEPPARLTMALLAIPLLVSTTLEMLSIGMVLPVVELVISGESAWLSPIRSYLPLNSSDLLIVVIVLFCLLFVAKNLFILWTTWLINDFTNHQMARFLRRMYNLYIRRPYAFHLTRHSADIQRNLNYSAPVAFDGLRLALNMVLEGLLVAGAFALLLIMEPLITLGAAMAIGTVGLFFLRVIGPAMRRWGTLSHDLQADTLRHIVGSLSTVREIKLLGVGPHMTTVYGDLTDRLARYLTLSLTAQHIPRLMLETLIVLSGLGLIVILLRVQGSTDGLFSLIGLFGMAALRLLPSANRILQYAAELRHRTAPISALHEDLVRGIAEAEKEDQTSADPLAFQHRISLKNVSFRYDSDKAPALRDVTLSIKRGETIGLVGPSGAGKSTVADILLGFLRPSTGTVCSDGRDIHDDLPAWKRNLGYVPQQINLLDDTARRNIAFGIADENIIENRVMHAVRLAHLDPVIRELPDGLDTVLGEQGVRLSGGQRQRIGIARALYRDPPVLVLDEATSALDNESENAISQTIAELGGIRTVIIIAHRLSTVKKCDMIVFMQAGRVVDQGPFDDLARRCASFRRMVELGSMADVGETVTAP